MAELACVKCGYPAYTIFDGKALCKPHFESSQLYRELRPTDKDLEEKIRSYKGRNKIQK